MQVKVAQKSISNKEVEAAIEAINSRIWTEDKYCAKFSDILKEYHNRKYCQLVNSGSSANLIALNACKISGKWDDGDEVITCALGFPTTVAPIIQLGLQPVFVDSKGLNIDIDKIEEKISKKTKAVMIAHTLGFPFDIKAIRRICNKYRLLLIEDVCDAIGSRCENILCGTLGDVSTFSFYPAHCITSIEGGAILTDNSQLGSIMNSLVNWGRSCTCLPGQNNRCGHRFDGKIGDLPRGWDHKYTYINLGYNLKMNDIEAAIGSVQMLKLDRFVEIRRQNYLEYSDRIIYESEELPEGCNPFGFVLHVEDSIAFIKKLLEKEIDARLVMGGNLLRQPAFKKYGNWRDYPEATRVSDTTLWIGVQPSLSLDEKEFTINTINKL